MKAYDLSLILILVAVVAAVGVGSSHFLGNDNEIEEMTEDFLGDFIEDRLGLPEGTVDFDLSPGDEKEVRDIFRNDLY